MAGADAASTGEKHEVGPLRIGGDLAAFSPEAIRAFRESAIEPIKNGTFSLRQIENRINTVRAEIVQVWNSALPEDEKFRIINARENEISLLQAGQFTFAKAGFSRTA
nr:hypothetical protein [Pseudodesulfovibrio alkaliphilus]